MPHSTDCFFCCFHSVYPTTSTLANKHFQSLAYTVINTRSDSAFTCCIQETSGRCDICYKRTMQGLTAAGAATSTCGRYPAAAFGGGPRRPKLRPTAGYGVACGSCAPRLTKPTCTHINCSCRATCKKQKLMKPQGRPWSESYPGLTIK